MVPSPDPAAARKGRGYLFLFDMFTLGRILFVYGMYYISLMCLHQHTALVRYSVVYVKVIATWTNQQ